MNPPDTMTLRELTRRLLRRWVLMTSVGGGVLVAVALWILLVTPRYKSTAVVRILPPQTQLGTSMSTDVASSLPGASLLGLGQDEVDTEVGVLKSWRVASAVVDSTALMVQVTKPEGIRRHILSVEERGDPSREARLTFRRSGSGYDVEVKEPHEPARSLPHVQDAGELRFAGYRFKLAPRPADSIPSAIKVRIRSHYEAVRKLRKKLQINRVDTRSRLVEITYENPDRELAADVVNGVLNEYVAYKTAAEHGDSRNTVKELQAQVADEARKLAEAEDRLQAYQERAEIVAPEEEATQQVRRQAELLLAQDKLRVERSSLDQLLAVVDSQAALRKTDPNAAYRQLATFPSLIGNRAIQDLLSTLVDLENQRSEFLTRRTEQSRDVRQLNDRISQLEGELHRLGTDYLQSLDEQISSTSAALGRIDEVLRKLPRKETDYLRLYRDRTMLNDGYLLLQKQLRLAEVQDAIRGEGVRVVDRGLVAPKDDPAFPKPAVDFLLGLVLAAAAGIGAALLSELWA